MIIRGEYVPTSGKALEEWNALTPKERNDYALNKFASPVKIKSSCKYLISI